MYGGAVKHQRADSRERNFSIGFINFVSLRQKISKNHKKIIKNKKNHKKSLKNANIQKKKRLRPDCLPQKFYILKKYKKYMFYMIFT